MPVFADLVRDSTAPLRHIEGFAPAPLDPDLRYIERAKNGSVLSLSAEFWRVGDYGDLRGVFILSPKIEVVNLFFFPTPTYALPVYALEVVIFGQRPMVGIIDLPNLASDNDDLARRLLREAHQRFPLPQADDPPAWYQACRSGADFFTRPADLDRLSQLDAAHRWLWAQLCAHISSAKVAPHPAVHHAALQHYKHHHRDNITGLPFLNSSFGTDWTQRFLQQGLFA